MRVIGDAVRRWATRPGRSRVRAAGLALGLALLPACRPGATSDYRPRVRNLTVTAVPLLTREQAATYPFLSEDFAPGGILEGKEVYAFVPSTLTAYRGDTLVLDLVNPEDDLHTFVLDGHEALDIPGQSTVTDTIVAREAGISRFVCDIPAHSPFMYGQLVVLPPP
ncbi:MAG TPA: cupredoxin domain-containing protein [Gemmatimonadota bacterium]|nr:cupredoxin domain-containing protein [Gemmatimonadota bacterium]